MGTFITPYRGGIMPEKKVWLRPSRVARHLDCNLKHVYFLVRTGELEAIKLGVRNMRISESSVDKFIIKNMVKPTEKN
jgi:excisionase family DNA binding protein